MNSSKQLLSNAGAGELTWQIYEAISPPVWIEVPWVGVVPTSGVTPADDSTLVDVTFEAADLEPGDCYTASLGLVHDDSGWGSPTLIPSTLCVEAVMPSFYITKSVDPSHQYPGLPVTYTILFGNAGGPAAGVWVTDVLPSAVEYAWSDPAGSYDPARHELGWGPLSLASGDRVTATLGVTLSESAVPGTWLTNSVYLSHEQTVLLSAQAFHQVHAEPTCEPVLGLSLTSVTPGSLYVGTEVEFRADVWPDEATMPYSYTIDFGDGSTPPSGSTSDDPLTFQHTFENTGTYEVEIQVWNCDMDEADAVVDTVQVTVYPPSVCVDITSVDLTLVTTGDIYPNDQGDFRANITPGDATLPFNYTIDYGDGSAGDSGTSSALLFTFSYSYTIAGTYTVEFAAWNCDMAAPIIDTVEVVVMPVEETYTIYLPIVIKED